MGFGLYCTQSYLVLHVDFIIVLRQISLCFMALGFSACHLRTAYLNLSNKQASKQATATATTTDAHTQLLPVAKGHSPHLQGFPWISRSKA